VETLQGNAVIELIAEKERFCSATLANNSLNSYKQTTGPPLPFLDKNADEAGIIQYANGSRIEVSTANNVKTGRSASLRFLHLSEFAFWRDAATLMSGLMQSVPDDPDTTVIIESTANGRGGEFYKRWMEASDTSRESEWITVFFAWWERPEYSRPLIDPAGFQSTLSREEQQLAESHQLTLGQLHWRRWCIANNCGAVRRFRRRHQSSTAHAACRPALPAVIERVLARDIPALPEASLNRSAHPTRQTAG
jgi:hypothetical protein